MGCYKIRRYFKGDISGYCDLMMTVFQDITRIYIPEFLYAEIETQV